MRAVLSGVARWPRPFFGQPALLLRREDYWVVGGPLRQPPGGWLWSACSGPTELGRVLARGKLKVGLRALPDPASHGYAVVRTASTCYLIARDGVGPYVTAFAPVAALGTSEWGVLRELGEAAEWLRRERQKADDGPSASGAERGTGA
jgi:hypothetical protein